MANEKKETAVEASVATPVVAEKKPKKAVTTYKGYSIKWLRKEVDHPDFGLVAEFDKLNAKKSK